MSPPDSNTPTPLQNQMSIRIKKRKRTVLSATVYCISMDPEQLRLSTRSISNLRVLCYSWTINLTTSPSYHSQSSSQPATLTSPTCKLFGFQLVQVLELIYQLDKKKISSHKLFETVCQKHAWVLALEGDSSKDSLAQAPSEPHPQAESTNRKYHHLKS